MYRLFFWYNNNYSEEAAMLNHLTHTTLALMSLCNNHLSACTHMLQSSKNIMLFNCSMWMKEKVNCDYWYRSQLEKKIIEIFFINTITKQHYIINTTVVILTLMLFCSYVHNLQCRPFYTIDVSKPCFKNNTNWDFLFESVLLLLFCF